jgi:hypothetical protein
MATTSRLTGKEAAALATYQHLIRLDDIRLVNGFRQTGSQPVIKVKGQSSECQEYNHQKEYTADAQKITQPSQNLNIFE